MKKIVVLLSILCLISCEKIENVSIDEEKAVFEQTLPLVLDKIYLSIFPPHQNDSMINLYENGKLLIIIKDSTEIISKEDQNRFSKYYKDISITIDSSYQTKVDEDWYESKSLNLHKIKLNLKNEKYNFKFDSDSHNLTNNEKLYCGKISLSEIKLDVSKQYALYSISYKCCDTISCGNGWNVYLRKSNDSWKIDKIIRTWIN